MARLPFEREIEDLFASDRSVVLKLIAGAFVGAICSGRVVFKEPTESSPSLSMPAKIAFLAVSAATGAIVVLGLLLRDVVVRRVQRGQRVNPLLRAYFGQGNGCLMLGLWFVTVILATFVVTLVLLSR